MRGFDDVIFTWNGESYSIPANKVLGAIARVEDIITLHELQRYSKKESTPLAKLSMAYGVLLRYAGCRVSDVEIYEAMFGSGNVKPDEIVNAVIILIAMMVPPAAHAQNNQKEQGQGKAKPAAAKIKK